MTKHPVAKFNKFLHAAPQFRPIKRGARRRGITRTYISNDGQSTVEIDLGYELDIADQDLLICLVAMSTTNNCQSTVVSPDASNLVNIDLRERLGLTGGFVTRMSTISVSTNAHELLIELGRKPGRASYNWLKDSLKRLSKVSFIYTSKTQINSFNLISWSADLEKNGGIGVISFCINPYSAAAILDAKGGYVLLHRNERALLKTEEARALHSVLCGLVDIGKSRSLSVDMLCGKVYSTYEGDTDDVITCDKLKHRRKAICSACVDISKLAHWACNIDGRGGDAVAIITRKSKKGLA